MTKKTIELLAPAGNLEAYKAAVAAGADAVYLGAKGFNARQQADNFEETDLVSVIEDAHIKGIKVYFVLNTLLKDNETEEACNLASFVYKQGVDAVIVQDLGLVSILRKFAPDLPLHASTQMAIHNSDGAKAAQALGIERVILSRELSLKEIKSIVLNSGVEVEVFAHGALCVSRSGLCLLSSFIGGRSGNRGRCAQPCRLPWKTDDKSMRGDYLLSPKDLMALEILPELIDAGITALKIEGRMKSPEYVAAVVSVYRKYLDIAIQNTKKYKVMPEDILTLMQVFNRGGFTTGYFNGHDFESLMSTKHPKHGGVLVGATLSQEDIYQPKYGSNEDNRLIRIKLSSKICMGDGLEIRDAGNSNPSAILSVMFKDGSHVKTADRGDTLLAGNFKNEAAPQSDVYKTYDKALMESLTAMSRNNLQRVPINGEFTLLPGEFPVLNIVDNDGNAVHTMGDVKAQEAKDRPTTTRRIEEQLKKTKDTPYFFESVIVNTNNKSFIPVSEINLIRRKSLEELMEKRKNAFKKTEICIIQNPTYFPGNTQKLSRKKELSLYFYNMPVKLNWESLGASRLYFPFTDLEQIEKAKKYKFESYICLPAILHDHQMDWIINRIKPFSDIADGVLIGNLGSLNRIKSEFPEMPVALDFQMNVFNAMSVDAFKTYLPTSIALSLEMNINEIQQIKSPGIPLEVYIYGEIPVMVMEYCPGSSIGECTGKCPTCVKNKGYVTDRIGKRFLYKTDPFLQRTTLFNSDKLMLNDVSPLKETDVDTLRIGIMDETCEEISKLCDFYRKQWVEGNEKSFTNPADKLYETGENRFTRGHFYRGVE